MELGEEEALTFITQITNEKAPRECASSDGLTLRFERRQTTP
jgi:hypothetical protein